MAEKLREADFCEPHRVEVLNETSGSNDYNNLVDRLLTDSGNVKIIIAFVDPGVIIIPLSLLGIHFERLVSLVS